MRKCIQCGKTLSLWKDDLFGGATCQDCMRQRKCRHCGRTLSLWKDDLFGVACENCKQALKAASQPPPSQSATPPKPEPIRSYVSPFFLGLVGIVLISSGLLLGIRSQYLFSDMQGQISRIELKYTPGSKRVRMITDAGKPDALWNFLFIAVCLSGFGGVLLVRSLKTKKSPSAQEQLESK